MRPNLPPSLFATSRTILNLRAEIAGATGLSFVAPLSRGAGAAVWRRGTGARLLPLSGRPVVLVEPGPLLSPYDTPETGLASLRLAIGGRPIGGHALGADLISLLRAHRLAHVVADEDAAPILPEEQPSDAALLARTYGAGVHYFDPWTRRPIDFRDCVERVAWLRDRFAGNDRRVVYVGMSRWKRPAMDVFGAGPWGRPIHTMKAEDAVEQGRRHGGQVLAWATRAPQQLERLCAEAGLPLARVEDGFIRSVGLGASLQPGASIVVDDLGIYYDPRRESRLARLLAEAQFPAELVARGKALRESIVARRLSKYNVGLAGSGADWPAGRRIVLVPGQVEDDASVLHGSPHVRSNRALLEAARARNPDAFLLFKPHPDVEAGFRVGAIPEAEALRLADRIVSGISIVDLLDRVHHVETMTSLAGFEALIRGLTVAVHGRPFYAGWGLTEDLAPGADRGRRLALDELAAAALILYPRYLDPVAMKPCTPEHLLDRLSEARDLAPASALSIGRARQLFMRARYAVVNPILRRLRARRGVARGPSDKR
ncbi:capsular polysaccharide export protein, LipB/KpsS family [Methylobacterium sp. sgz302541]|uniref:capsular polysaccharide export protein, LipB/KpsS family n=1 Tax=unclassified Methylobacterium TaxID=2615210 RepID=UPI003D351907